MNTGRLYRDWSQRIGSVLACLFLWSCDVMKEDTDNCGVYLEFIYNYNMEYVDSFDPWVNTVDIFVFDADERFLFTKHARREELVGEKQMLLADNLPVGHYKILTVGGLTNHFRVSDARGNALSPGETMLEDVRIALERISQTVSHEFSPLWIGKTIEIDYKADRGVYSVSLVKNTNHFHVLLAEVGGSSAGRADRPAFIFEILTPEGAVYGHDNVPRVQEPVTYMPYSLMAGEGPEVLSEGHVNTVRLLYDEDYDYKLIVYDTRTGLRAWDYDLMKLLESRKPMLRPDGSTLPVQEFLDRQSEWRLVILYKEGENPSDFVALSIEVNGWIVWRNDIEV